MFRRRPLEGRVANRAAAEHQSSVHYRNTLRLLLCRQLRRINRTLAVPYKFFSDNIELVEARADRLLALQEALRQVVLRLLIIQTGRLDHRPRLHRRRRGKSQQYPSCVAFLLHSDAPMQQLQELVIYRVDGGLVHLSTALAANADADAMQTGCACAVPMMTLLLRPTPVLWLEGPVHAYKET